MFVIHFYCSPVALILSHIFIFFLVIDYLDYIHCYYYIHCYFQNNLDATK